jgi:RNA polymerase sigma-70 factor (ECF subfamily)
MSDLNTTCWTVIREAAEGHPNAREEFARTYMLAVRAYLKARWSNPLMRGYIDDATQEVFLECFRDNSPLKRVGKDTTNSFRAYLFGLVRNTARNFEKRLASPRNQPGASLSNFEIASNDPSLSMVFDRAWARTIIRQAGEKHRENAKRDGEAALRRVELLTLRFQHGLPIRHIADQWNADATVLHREYAKARDEFRAAMREVVRFHHPGTEAEMDNEVKLVMQLLSP